MALAAQLLQSAADLVADDSASEASIRRAVSAAYYAVFHAVATAVADRFVGPASAPQPAYDLFYRLVDHARMRRACEAVERRSAEATAYFEASIPVDVGAFAAAFLTLQSARHLADYAPRTPVTVAAARLLSGAAEAAVAALAAVNEPQRTDFLAYLLAQPRR